MWKHDRIPLGTGNNDQPAPSSVKDFSLGFPCPSILEAQISEPLILTASYKESTRVHPPHGSVLTVTGYCYVPNNKNVFAAGYGGWSRFLGAHALSVWEDEDIHMAAKIKKELEDLEVERKYLGWDAQWMIQEKETRRILTEEADARRERSETKRLTKAREVVRALRKQVDEYQWRRGEPTMELSPLAGRVMNKSLHSLGQGHPPETASSPLKRTLGPNSIDDGYAGEAATAASSSYRVPVAKPSTQQPLEARSPTIGAQSEEPGWHASTPRRSKRIQAKANSVVKVSKDAELDVLIGPEHTPTRKRRKTQSKTVVDPQMGSISQERTDLSTGPRALRWILPKLPVSTASPEQNP